MNWPAKHPSPKANSNANVGRTGRSKDGSARSQDSLLASDCEKSCSVRTSTGKFPPSEAQVAAYKREDLQAVYREFYTPENGILLLVGDFDSNTMLKSAEKVLVLDRKKADSKAAAAPPNPRGRRVYLVHVPGAVQTQILAGVPRHHPQASGLG